MPSASTPLDRPKAARSRPSRVPLQPHFARTAALGTIRAWHSSVALLTRTHTCTTTRAATDARAHPSERPSESRLPDDYERPPGVAAGWSHSRHQVAPCGEQFFQIIRETDRLIKATTKVACFTQDDAAAMGDPAEDQFARGWAHSRDVGSVRRPAPRHLLRLRSQAHRRCNGFAARPWRRLGRPR